MKLKFCVVGFVVVVQAVVFVIMISKNSHVMSIVKNHGFGLSCGISFGGGFHSLA